MKEATGELNMTVVTVVAVAAIAAFFYAFVWPKIKSNINNNTKCSSAVCTCKTAGVCPCTYISESNSAETINCNVRGNSD